MASFPPAFVERLRGAISVPELIGKRVSLRKIGHEWTACCPFHKEKSPSFRVYPDHYHCFGCGAHGDAIEFLKRYERLSYPEAVEKLAREVGMALPEISPQAAAKAENARSLYQVMEEACKFFERELLSERGLIARQYLERRGIKSETIQQYRLGYAPDTRDALKRALTARGVTDAQMVEAGLLIRPDSGAPYDRFRGRLMFAICDNANRVIAFGGRILADPPPGAKPLAKYLNSPETPLFKKGENVYNLNLASRPAREAGEIVLVEGYMDVIAVFQAGFQPVAAPLGTAITPEQLKRLWQLADTPILCLDGDAAGLRASLRAAELALPLLMPGKSLKFATLPKGEDPDSLIAKEGLPHFRDILSRARELHEVLLNAAISENPSTTPSGRAKLEQKLMGFAEVIPDATLKSHFRNYFREQLWKANTPAKHDKKKLSPRAPLPAPKENSVRPLLQLLLMEPRLLEDHEIEEEIMRIDCSGQAESALRHGLLEAVHQGVAPSEMLSHLHAQGHSATITALMHSEQILLPKDISESLAKAKRHFHFLLDAYYTRLLEEEYRAIETALTQSSDVMLYEQMLALQKELQMRQKARLSATLTYGD